MSTRLESDERDYIRSALGRKMGKFAERIERISVRFDDLNGPKGGRDTQCRIKVTLSHLAPVVVEQKALSWREAFDVAADDTERAARRQLGRARDSARRAQA